MDNNIIDEDFQALLNFDEGHGVMHHLWSNFCMVGINEHVQEDNVP